MTKEEFKRRWEKDERGDGITFEDVAQCAIKWGITKRQYIRDMQRLLQTVLRAAGISEEPDERNEDTEKSPYEILL